MGTRTASIPTSDVPRPAEGVKAAAARADLIRIDTMNVRLVPPRSTRPAVPAWPRTGPGPHVAEGV